MNWLDHLLKGEQGGPVPVLPCVFDPTLETLCAGLPLEDVQELREERAAILEHDGGMSREDAERLSGCWRKDGAQP